jgi:hypothetical protein
MVAQLSPLRRRMIEDMTDLDRSRKQITRLHRITGDAQDRRSAFRELAGNLQPGSAGAADNAVGSRHAVCPNLSQMALVVR